MANAQGHACYSSRVALLFLLRLFDSARFSSFFVIVFPGNGEDDSLEGGRHVGSVRRCTYYSLHVITALCGLACLYCKLGFWDELFFAFCE